MAENSVYHGDRFLEDKLTLLQLFPALLWTTIFEKCDSDTLTALNNTSLCIRDWLMALQTSFLFSKVWRDVRKLRWQVKQDCFNLRRITSEGSVDYYRDPFVTRILELRLVCKHWCQGIQTQCLEKLTKPIVPATKQCIGISAPDIVTKLELTRARFVNSSQIAKFQSTFLNSGSSSKPTKLICGSILIHQLNAEMCNVLEYIGRNVLHCKIFIYQISDDEGDKYVKLVAALRQMPNLKTLDIAYNYSVDYMKTFQIECDMRQHSLCELSKLENLYIKNVPLPIVKELIKCCSKVVNLNVTLSNKTPNNFKLLVPLPNLINLSYPTFTEEDLDQLDLLQNEGKLKQLYLNVATKTVLHHSKLKTLLRGKWKNVVTTIMFEYYTWHGRGEDIAGQLYQ